MDQIRRADAVTSEPSGDRVIILDATGESIITLNPSGSVVWEALAEPQDLDAIVTVLAATFPDVEEQQLRTDAEAFVVELEDAGLIVLDDAPD